MPTWSAPCAMGLESVVSRELKFMGADNVTAEDRRVFFDGDMSMMARANLGLRSAERVQLVLGRFTAHTFDMLFEGVHALPLEDFIGRDDAFPVKGHCLSSQLSSVPSCQSIIKKAAVTRLSERYKLSQFPESGPVKQLQFLLRKDEVTLLLDTSGAGLHKRGYRPLNNEAPIRETLAAGMLALSQLHRFDVLQDPFCGSGTVLIEGALLAARIAPGLRRRFAAERYGSVFTASGGVPDVFRSERERALSAVRHDIPFRAYGRDNDPQAVALTLDNARRAGVSDAVSAELGEVSAFTPQPGSLLVTNPPYGERLLDIQQSERLYHQLGKRVSSGACGIITPHKEFEALFNRKAAKRRKLFNGTIECQYYMYF